MIPTSQHLYLFTMTFFLMKKFLVVMFCSLLFKTVVASCSNLDSYGYDFSVTPVATCPNPQFPTPTYYGVFFQACMTWAGSFIDTPGGTNEVKSKKTGCTFYKEGFFYSSSYKQECCNLADCNAACVRHIVMCCVR